MRIIRRMINNSDTNTNQVKELVELIGRLSVELSNNRQLSKSLESQVDQLKDQVVHTVSGFTLRRYNTDISTEQFEFECEKFNAELIKENQLLQLDNKQLTSLVKEFEQVIHIIMDKFRQESYSTQVHELNLIKHFETIIGENFDNFSKNEINKEIDYNNLFNKLSNLLINSIRSLDDVELSDKDVQIIQLENENKLLRDLLGLGLS